jgi:hypothetical protein
MNNESRIFLNEDGVVEIIYAEHVNFENQAPMQQEVYEIALKLADNGVPARFLIDLSHVVEYETQAQHLASRGVSDIEIYKTAAFGARSEIQKIHRTVYEHGKKLNMIRYFKTRAEALVWLME